MGGAKVVGFMSETSTALAGCLAAVWECSAEEAVERALVEVVERYRLRITKDQVCAYCLRTNRKFVRDHVVPDSRGGPNTSQNLVVACVQCNSAKRDQTASEWGHPSTPQFVLARERDVLASMGAPPVPRIERRGRRQKATDDEIRAEIRDRSERNIARGAAWREMGL